MFYCCRPGLVTIPDLVFNFVFSPRESRYRGKKKKKKKNNNNNNNNDNDNDNGKVIEYCLLVSY
jgi:hypothetical protein